ncbi:Cys-tRNA(Pro) deacylase [Collinsella sp. AGMB00827]|uniref:Cys-tRNA(Pro)/Cys-tRNA(Cys) deacylase n=1 Tax=Collinsella ureilytica TaxID=2869515 RepID=A0ABS7MI83_9ACTN|nr:Cys-tRNA(Pro) deacylase [Collinsella urealyticum]MBY4797071.1 Cys-tRNA(Pro) deacylase [Collinsella urealyticum]
MAAKGLKKTNAMRELDRAGISYAVHEYEVDEDDLSGTHVATILGQDPARVFKTLVTSSPDGHAACCVPVDRELNLKAAARALHVKSLTMLPLADLLSTTGYVRGGCSPIGMKRPMPLIVDTACRAFSTIMISGGCRGLQIEVGVDDLLAYTQGVLAKIATEDR